MLQTLALVAAAASSPVPLAPASLALGDELVLEVDERSHMPKGRVARADGLILDPRDLPKPVLELMSCAVGLQGLEASLTALLARSVGFASRRDDLPKRYREFGEHQAAQWTALSDVLFEGSATEGGLVGAALYHDTGRRIDSPTEVRIVGPTRFAAVTMAPADFEDLLQLQADTARFDVDMPQAAAKRLSDRMLEQSEGVEDPWFTTALLRVTMLGLDMWDDKYLENSFDLSPDEYMDRCRRAIREGLVEPLFPELDEERRADGVWLLEGFVVGRRVHADGDWSAPEALIEQNEVVHQPILLLQAPAEEPEDDAPRRRVSMIAGGEEIVLYDGDWPMP